MIYEETDSPLNFYLHAVVIHDGGDNSGHYFVHIKDHKTGKFWKFNDQTVSFVSFEEMYWDAQGENGQRSAYCLFYIDKSTLKSDQISSVYEPAEESLNAY